ncbi:hypothetical protein SpAn4DRAFT_0901 [Sporomusa ovata]|uniref:Uncharacterized protein n=1 Tax=Sporomusa ovata TaxID=2378 RepID=A0A0U1L563_9FIRM|nr:hypothetical protein SpAn4DRAFT_0901 [Sporomusa ovata]
MYGRGAAKIRGLVLFARRLRQFGRHGLSASLAAAAGGAAGDFAPWRSLCATGYP